ncbi:MAG: erythromycin esterase family protein [Longimicrobiales bacterium]
MRRTLVGLFVVVAAIILSAQTRQEAAVAEWVRSTAIRLRTVEAGHGFADLQPLKPVVGNARIVSLGEATHGTREFFQLKHRLLEFLATEMGFTIFSIEANLPEAYRLNDYVLRGVGDPRQLLRGMYFWTWDTEEVLDMILWMRAFNASGRGRVQFTGFDMQTPTVAMEIVQAFVTRYDAPYLTAIARANDEIRALSAAPSFGVATSTFPVAPAAGRRVRYSGFIKTTGVTRGYAGFWWRVDGESGVLAFDNMSNRGVTGTSEWARYDIELPVAGNARNINFGALHTGDGSAWFDGLTIELDGVPYTNQSFFDLDFESTTPRGFAVGGAGYEVQLDRQVVRSGSQSLRMTYRSAAPAQIDPARVSATWKDVVRYLEANRATYQSRGATNQEIEWAARNAIVVLQGVQMRTNEVSRDRSMAENIKWILDQSPKEKIVLWAHNGHVAAGELEGFEPMGSTLRKMYGTNMVVFGFAFYQGAFQAMGRPIGLSTFTVDPAPAGSLDATLAAARISAFALDWRRAPLAGRGGLVVPWLNEQKRTRWVGSTYFESAPDNFWIELRAREMFDVTLFIDMTTAARPNPR